ncbi:hypothetical protein L349_05484 [Enterobacter sp. MGH 3]|nr:hypothetical protein PGS1_01970 [Enterobacter cloacae subsp. cloacae GS1]EUM32544.1 hypothetical protein L435_06111 [Enterobacter hormaechei]EUN12986.1 hypothetical protein L349_05484 [Enterobacter sp. MGH 3]KLW56216.1 hypothetical protein SK56_00820 [Enterobacter sp. MGH128]KLW86245.1 hypothetical protein SK61_01455 [Enterobacter sp. BIDMC100]CAE7770311.1 hypothetical protein AI2796V1_2695 [Enterobacter cloacae]
MKRTNILMILITTSKNERFKTELKNTLSSIFLRVRKFVFFIKNKSNFKQEVHPIAIFNDLILCFLHATYLFLYVMLILLSVKSLDIRL